MTNEEARQWFLKVYAEIKGQGYADENEEAYELAIKALEQEPCEDAVSRQAVINIVKLRWDYYKNCIEAIEKLPPVRPQEQTGHWVDINGGVECDKCGKWYPHAPIAKNEIKFCCECGARMVEPQESEDKK